MVNWTMHVFILLQLVCVLLKVTWCLDTITTIAGTGTATYSNDQGAATSAGLNNPFGVRLDAAGNQLLIHLYLFFISSSFPT